MRPKVGDGVFIDGRRYVVTHVQARLTPYKNGKSQDTRIEGWTVGLKEDLLWF